MSKSGGDNDSFYAEFTFLDMLKIMLYMHIAW